MERHFFKGGGVFEKLIAIKVRMAFLHDLLQPPPPDGVAVTFSIEANNQNNLLEYLAIKVLKRTPVNVI